MLPELVAEWRGCTKEPWQPELGHSLRLAMSLVIVLCSWPTGSATAKLMMSVKLVVFSLFHPKTLDWTAKTGPRSRPFVPGRSLSCLFTHSGSQIHTPYRHILKHVQAHWRFIYKAYIIRRNTQQLPFLNPVICELTWLTFSTVLNKGIIFLSLWMKMPGHPDRGFNNSYPLILLRHRKDFVIKALLWSYSLLCSHHLGR